MLQSILEKITSTYGNCPFILAIVLSGSRATGSKSNNSDIDIFDNALSNPVISAQILRELCHETEKLCANINL